MNKKEWKTMKKERTQITQELCEHVRILRAVRKE